MIVNMYECTEILSEDPPIYAVSLSASTDQPPELKVTITYPDEAYPESGPLQLEVESISKNRRIFTTSLKKELLEMAEQSIGDHCALNILQQAQDFLITAAEELDKAALVKKGEQMSANSTVQVTADPTIRMGNAISKELFLEWQKKHMEHKEALRAATTKNKKESASKMTGRQLWDSSLRNTDWELFGAEEGDAIGIDDAGFDYVLEDEEGEEKEAAEGDEDYYDFGEEEEGGDAEA